MFTIICKENVMRNDQLEIQPEHFEFESEAPFGEMENGVGEFEEEFGEFEGSFGEMEAPATQKNWYYFDAWRRAADGSVSRMAKYGPRQETESEASRLFDVFCLNNQNSGQGSGKVLMRCYQWFPVSSRWVACKNVVGFKRGMCSSDESELAEFEAFETGPGEFENLGEGEIGTGLPRPGGRQRGATYLRKSKTLRSRSVRAASPSMEFEGEVGFDSPSRSPRQVRSNFVSCNPANAAVTAITGADPLGAIRQAAARGVQMLDRAINQLQIARNRVRNGAAPVAPAVSDVIRDALQNRFHMVAGNRNIWTQSDPRSVLVLIRRLRGARQILADGWMRYTCLGPIAPARVTLGSGSNSCTVLGCEPGEIAFTCGGISRIVLCRLFWRDDANNPTDVDFRASILAHEAIHIYFGFIADSGRFANAHCYQQFVMDLNGVPVPTELQGQCPV
jgi:hypothetical protein